jgi:hypothetical protein
MGEFGLAQPALCIEVMTRGTGNLVTNTTSTMLAMHFWELKFKPAL